MEITQDGHIEKSPEEWRKERRLQIERLHRAALELSQTNWNDKKMYEFAESWYRAQKTSLETIEHAMSLRKISTED